MVTEMEHLRRSDRRPAGRTEKTREEAEPSEQEEERLNRCSRISVSETQTSCWRHLIPRRGWGGQLRVLRSMIRPGAAGSLTGYRQDFF